MTVKKTLEELAVLVGGRVAGDGSVVITGAAGLEGAGPGDISFCASSKYARLLEATDAGAVIVRDGGAGDEGKGINLLLVENPMLAWTAILKELSPQPPPPPGVHPGAEVHPDAVFGRDVSIGANAFVDCGVRLGDGVVIMPGVYIGRDVRIGDGTVIYPNVSIREGTKIGKRVVIHCNSVIGGDGFGYVKVGSRHHKIPQVGIVRIGDDVEIGACVTVDRATTGETVIGRGTKIDNLVQFGHNVRIGEDAIIVAQVGIAGSTTVGNRVTLAGQAGVIDHIEIGDDTTVGAQSLVKNILPPKGVFTGYPALPHGEWLRAQSIFSKLPEMKKKLRELEKKVEALEGKGK
ncbi:MAG: UDP-3-O-(3-hydroxymyristoyl)glucosamine N-acyltransferase [Thermodesulfobacteriota bacterium]